MTRGEILLKDFRDIMLFQGDIQQVGSYEHGGIGDFREEDISTLPRPDAVFIGGHGGHLQEIIEKVLQYLNPGGCIVMNSVKAPKVLTDSHQLWDEACQKLGLTQEPPIRIVLDEHHPIEILKCKK